MYVLLIDKESQTIFWQELSARTLQRGPKGGRFILVPRTNVLPSAGDAWDIAAEQFAQIATTDYSENLTHLPPSTAHAIRSLASVNTSAAKLLAAHLGRGRGAPAVVVRTLLDSEPKWLYAAGFSRGLGILGDYAHSHGHNDVAAEALLRAADRDPDATYINTLNSALILAESNTSQATELLRAAATMNEAESDPRIAIGEAILRHPSGSAVPVALSPDVEAQLKKATDDDLVLSFLAVRCEHSGDLDAAEKLASAALALAPDAAAHMVSLARILGQRARTPHAQNGDRKRAVNLATEALDQIHAWSGPTDSALDTLLKIHTSAGMFAAALDRALPQPDGRATDHEAQRVSVRVVAATAAEALGRPHLAAEIIDLLPPGVDQDFARLRSGRPQKSADGERDAWIDLVARLDISRPEALVKAVLRLGDLGVDESARLDPLVQLNILSPDARSVISLNAAAVSDLAGSLPALRVLADRDVFAASKLIELLTTGNQLDDAEAAADAAFLRFGNPEYAVRRAELLAQLGRIDEAQEVATDALAISNIDPVHRQLTHRVLADLLVSQTADTPASTAPRQWRRIEQHLHECVNADDGLAPQDRDILRLADVQMRLGNERGAYETFSQHNPSMSSSSAVLLWLQVMQSQTVLTQHIYARMLDLADEYKDDPKLSAALLTTVVSRTRDADDTPASGIDNRPVVDGDLRAEAFAALHTHVERHGDDTPIKILQAPSTDDLIEKMTAFMRRDNEPLLEVAEQIRQVRMPLGVLSLVAHRPYASTVASRPLGYVITGAVTDEDDDADESAAHQATGHDVVVDTSALSVATELGEYENFRGEFRNLLVPTISKADVLRSRVELDGRSASSGSMVYDATTDSVAATDLDIDLHLATLTRFEQIESAMTTAQLVPAISTDDLPIDLPGAEPWLAPIVLARDLGLSLWSDDLAQRRLARALGVEAFGTTTLQQIRTADRLTKASADDTAVEIAIATRRKEVRAALAARIVDIPTDVEVIIEQASEEGWDAAVALVTIGRPGWWHMAVTPWTDLQLILRAARDAGAPATGWRHSAMWGVARLAPDDPSRAGTLMASVALLPIEITVDDDETVDHLNTANEIALLNGATLPSELLTEAAITLSAAGVSTYAPQDVGRLRTRLSATEPIRPNPAA